MQRIKNSNPISNSVVVRLCVLLSVAQLIGMVVILVVIVPYFGEEIQELESGTLNKDKDLLNNISSASRELSRSVGISVVRIEVDRDPSLVDDDLRQMFGGSGLPESTQGSGVVVSEDGYLLTNYHVVANADRIVVSIGSENHPGRLVGFDALTDLALLTVPNLDLPAIVWGNSDQVAVGDFVWAIGNPYGLQRSVTFGIISAVEQEGVSESHFQNFFQTDAAVNPGSSGGPVVNVEGKVIGINTAIVGKSFRGIGFAIPSNTAHDVVRQLRTSGRVRRGWLGVRLEDLSRDQAHERGIPDVIGAVVDSLSGKPGAASPARTAGIRTGDVIVQWNDISIGSAVQLGRLVAQAPIGASAQVRLLRNGRPVTVEVTVGDRP